VFGSDTWFLSQGQSNSIRTQKCLVTTRTHYRAGFSW